MLFTVKTLGNGLKLPRKASRSLHLRANMHTEIPAHLFVHGPIYWRCPCIVSAATYSYLQFWHGIGSLDYPRDQRPEVREATL